MGAGESAYAAPVACRPRQKYQCAGKVRTTARTRNPNRPNRTQRPNQPVVAVPDTEYCCDGMITLSIDQIDNYQRNAYGTTKWATDYAGRNPVEGVNGMIKQDGSFNPESCRVFGTAAHTIAALPAAVGQSCRGVFATTPHQALQYESRDDVTSEVGRTSPRDGGRCPRTRRSGRALHHPLYLVR